MNLEMFVTWIVVGLVTGWLISFLIRNGGHGRTWDVILGLVGSGAVSTVAAGLGALSEAGVGAIAVVSFVGATFMVVLQRKMWPSRTHLSVRDGYRNGARF
jgi:uncharacterized membrane protein YeaQ/YmgE (transglycosylase-associated protein family)